MYNIYMIKVEEDPRPDLILLVMLAFLLALVPVYQTVVDIGRDVTHQNHEDTITTPLPGNCPDCGYPDCGGCDGKPQITLEPTVIIPTLPTFGGTPAPATPDIPDPTQYPTVFVTFEINGILPTALATMGLPTIVPTLVPPRFQPSPVPVGN